MVSWSAFGLDQPVESFHFAFFVAVVESGDGVRQSNSIISWSADNDYICNMMIASYVTYY